MITLFMGIESLFVIVGAYFLLRSFATIKNLLSEFPKGRIVKQWQLVTILLPVSLIAHGVFLHDVFVNGAGRSHFTFVMAVTLLMWGAFAFVVSKLALHTVNNMRHLTTLEQESITDALTQLNNRRYFEQRLSEEIASSERHKVPLSLILIDIDHFKKVNDVYGHKVGDEVLKNVAKLVMETMRDCDIAARYGGEEMAVITPQTEKHDAAILAERIRCVIEKSVVATIGTSQEMIHVTVSCGICSLSTIVTDKTALIEEADQSLYLAKKFGRNRIVISNW